MRCRLRFLLLAPFAALAFALTAPPITIGERLPPIVGQSALGRTIELPAADAGKGRVIVFSFHGASTDFRRWMSHLDQSIAPNGPPIFEVITLGSVPPLFRKMTMDVVRAAVLRTHWARTLFLYTDEKVWKERLAVKPGRYSYVMIVDGAGVVRWMGAGPYSTAKLRQLRAALAAVENAEQRP